MAKRKANFRAQRSHRSPTGGKRSTSYRAAQVVSWVAMAEGKLRAGHLENGFHLTIQHSLQQKMPGHPQVNSAPVGRTEALGNAPAGGAIVVDGNSLGGGDRSRCAGRRPLRSIGAKSGLPHIAGGLDQGIA